MRRMFFAALVFGWAILSSISFSATYGGGSGTAADPYQIWTPEQMNTIGANPADWGKCFKLMADIDMSAYTGTLYNIIGNSSVFFTGTFDGNYHTINNFEYNCTSYIQDVGLFGCTSGAAIVNLGLENVNIFLSSAWIVGGLIGEQLNGSNVSNCYCKGSIISTYDYDINCVGGLIGLSEGSYVLNCYNMSSVESNSAVYPIAGGIVGFSYGTVSSCYNTGEIRTDFNDAIGGIVGYQEWDTTNACFWDIQTSGITTSIYGGGIGKTTAEMQTLSTFINADWDFTDTEGDPADWCMPPTDYPKLAWQFSPVSVPGVVGKSLSEAQTTITSAGLVLGNVTQAFSDSIPDGIVISQLPVAETTVGRYTVMNIVISKGIGFAVPDITGMSQANAQSAIISAGFTIGTITYEYHDFIETGNIISQSPGAGVLTEAGAAINLVVSLGRSVVPNVLGMNQSAAQSEIISAGLTIGTVSTSYHLVIPAGCVISQTPAGGQTVSTGTAINLVISLGMHYSGGSGTLADPYQIASKEDLLELAGNAVDYTKCFIMTADINMDGRVFTSAVIASDISLGNSAFDGTAFTGIFDGNGHVISNLTINVPLIGYIGLFGSVGSGGHIKNLGIENVNIIGDDYVGVLVGYNNYGTITSCYTTSSVKGNYYVGGLVGCNSFGTIIFCYATGAVNGLGSYIGGLAGDNKSGSINFSYATGIVNGKISSGGLVGRNSGSIISCYATGSVSASGSSIFYTGGLVGYNSNGTITFCHATGTINSQGDYIGGLAGSNSNGTISNCYARGNVVGSGYYSMYVGGLVGYLNSSNNSRIEKCYSVGKVTQPYNTSYTGGLVGYKEDGSEVNYSFWNKDTSWKTYSAGGTGKTTAEMQTLSTFTNAGWDFVNGTSDDLEHVWFIREGQDYPQLMWEFKDDKDGLIPLGFGIVNKTRVGRTSFEYQLGVIVRNSNTFDMTHVQMRLIDWDAAVQSVSDDSVIIDIIPAAALVTSTDTFKIVVDRSQSIVSSRLTWELIYYTAASGDQIQQTMMSLPLSALDATSGDITGDGNVNLDDFTVLARQWNTAPGNPSADIGLPLDGYVGIEDLLYLMGNWLN